MSFRRYTSAFSQASRAFAAGVFITGLLLVGFGVLILALPELFAYLAAMVFFVGGVGCAITAVKIFAAQKKLDKIDSDQRQPYRNNVHIRGEEYNEQ